MYFMRIIMDYQTSDNVPIYHNAANVNDHMQIHRAKQPPTICRNIGHCGMYNRHLFYLPHCKVEQKAIWHSE